MCVYVYNMYGCVCINFRLNYVRLKYHGLSLSNPFDATWNKTFMDVFPCARACLCVYAYIN